ncbi:MAG TPA: HAMP domain-containing sensor histidine kinase, partial [Gammaproteobacteria bacterium]|nr:HAMP domain-containing sensor histidine kinase [Gammaproteobacteria bacterium]
TAIHIDAQIDAAIESEVDALTAEYRNQSNPTALQQSVMRRSRLSAQRRQNAESGIRYYLLLDSHGRRIAGTLPAWPQQASGARSWVTYSIDAASAARARLTIPEGLDANDPLRVRGLAVRFADGRRLLVVETLDEAQELSNYILISLLSAIGLILVAGLLGGIWMGRHVVARLEAVRTAAAGIMAGDLSRRIPVTARRDEFSELAATLNEMLTRIEALMNGLRQVTDNVAHDLRSPLNRLRSRLEVTLRQAREPAEYQAAMEQAVADADSLLQTFNAMLNLAELESGISRERWNSVPLDALCEDVASVYEPLAESKNIGFACEIAPVTVRGNGRLLAQAVGNLLDNALKYTPAGGCVSLTLAREARWAKLTIGDSGPGIPPAERQRVFDRFVRLDDSRSQPGNGLGLSLVRAIAQLHGGRVELSDNAPGLQVRLYVVAAEPAGEG